MMATAFDEQRDWLALPGRCECDGAGKAVSIVGLGIEGCTLEADEVWPAAHDFVHLDIAGTMAMNGRITRVVGRRAEVRFFGQLHPAAIAKLLENVSR